MELGARVPDGRGTTATTAPDGGIGTRRRRKHPQALLVAFALGAGVLSAFVPDASGGRERTEGAGTPAEVRATR